jgi:uncharacterized protein
MYKDGDGVPQNYKIAAKWYHDSAEQGHSGAQMFLGQLYWQGLGVPQSNVRAHMWFNISASNGGGTQVLRDAVAEKMTPAQIVEAQELARVCYSSNYKNCD